MGGGQGSPAVTSGSAGTVIHLDVCRDASEQLGRDPGSLGRFPKRPNRHSRQERGFTAARARGCAGAPVSRLHTRLSASRPHTRAVSGPAAPARGRTRRLVPACHSASHRPRAVTARGMRRGGTRGQRAKPDLGKAPAASEHRSTGTTFTREVFSQPASAGKGRGHAGEVLSLPPG